jgi:hypothetical protein
LTRRRAADLDRDVSCRQHDGDDGDAGDEAGSSHRDAFEI